MGRRKTGPDARTVELLFARSGECCEMCGGAGEQIHHRRARGMGGTRREDANDLANLVHLCAFCHAYIESRREWAIENGWLVRQSGDPGSVPVRVGRSWFILSDKYVRIAGA